MAACNNPGNGENKTLRAWEDGVEIPIWVDPNNPSVVHVNRMRQLDPANADPNLAIFYEVDSDEISDQGDG